MEMALKPAEWKNMIHVADQNFGTDFIVVNVFLSSTYLYSLRHDL